MNSREFERHVCQELKEAGYWALNIPRNRSGAQPFDILAIGKHIVIATDAKMCSKGYLSADRIEDNQISAFRSLRNALVKSHMIPPVIGFACWYKSEIYFVSYYDFEPDDDFIPIKRSVALNDTHKTYWRNIIYDD